MFKKQMHISFTAITLKRTRLLKIMTTEYGQEITAMVEKNNLIGTQFHPEKSHLFGLASFGNFVESSHPQ